MIEQYGMFVEVWYRRRSPSAKRVTARVCTHWRAPANLEFTGISDPYEIPEDAEMRIDTTDISPDEAVQRIVLKLESLGLIRPHN